MHCAVVLMLTNLLSTRGGVKPHGLQGVTYRVGGTLRHSAVVSCVELPGKTNGGTQRQEIFCVPPV